MSLWWWTTCSLIAGGRGKRPSPSHMVAKPPHPLGGRLEAVGGGPAASSLDKGEKNQARRITFHSAKNQAGKGDEPLVVDHLQSHRRWKGEKTKPCTTHVH